MSGDEKPVSQGAKAVAIALALLAPARMAWIVFTYGENNLSNDYLNRLPLVLSMLDGTCSLGRFVREAWIGGAHSGLAIYPIYYLNARFFHWSVWVELALGLALVAATLVLLTLAIPDRVRWLLLPLLALLLFSTSRVTVFTFGECALQYGFAQLGVATGVYALVKWRERPIALAAALAIGGILASWSWGGGVMAWPVFAAALLAFRVRSLRAWAIFLGGATVGIAQYVWIIFFQAPEAGAMKMSSNLKIRGIPDLLGRPFIGGIGHYYGPSLQSQAIGLAGLAVLIVLLVRGRGGARRVSALVLVGWSVLVAIQVAMLRSEIAPWYANPMAFFWAGLAILFALTPDPVREAGVAGVAFLSLIPQRTWEDKSFYLPSRSPASAACLREWRTAPPECGALLIQWIGGGDPAWLGEPLERKHLSVFGPRRTYLLQGDVAVRRVAMEASNERAFLSRDDRAPADANGFRRLDLVLAAGAAVTWRIDLPPNLKSARFLTRVRAAPGDEMLARGARVDVVGGTAGARVFVPAKSRQTLSLDLRPYAGRSVTLRVLSEEAKSTVPLLFEAPRVELEITRETAKGIMMPWSSRAEGGP